MDDMRAVDRDFEAFARRGDLDAFARVYENTASRLLAIAVTLVRDPGEAEELVQQTYVAAIESGTSFRANSSVESWLAGILANRARRVWATRRPTGKAEEQIDAAPGPQRTASGRETLRHVAAKIDDLEEPYRSVAVLHLLHGLEPAAIAHALERPPATVRAQLMRARQRLQGTLPAGLAGAAIAVPATANLTAIKAAVQQRAAEYAASLPTLTTTSTAALIMTTTLGKSLLVGFASACAAAAWMFWPESSAPPLPSSPSSEASPVAIANADERTAPTSRFDTAPPSNRTSVDADRFGTLDVLIRIGDNGAPLAGVVITASGDQAARTRTHRATTNASGQARFDKLKNGSWWIRSTSDAPARWITVHDETKLVLEAGRPTWIEGLVVNRQQQAIAGAQIRMGRSSAYMDLQPIATSDDRGAFRLPMFALSHLEVSASGYQPVFRQIQHEGGPKPVRFELPAGGAPLRGIVVDATDLKPIPGAAVTLLADRSAELADGSSLSTHARRARTDADGRFAWSGLVPGPARLLIDEPDHAARIVDVELSAGTADELRIELDTGTALAGRVLDPDGNARAGVVIESRWHGEARPRTATTDHEGRYRVDGLTPGPVKLTARSNALGRRLGAGASFRLRPRTTNEWSPQIHDGFLAIAGKLRSENGLPLTDWYVVMRPASGGRGIPKRVAADGSFRFDRLLPDGDRILEACPPVADGSTRMPRTAPTRRWHEIAVGTTELELVVLDEQLPTSWLRGRVDRTQLPKSQRALFVSNEDGGRTIALMADDGTFEAGPLRAGKWTLAFGNRPENVLGVYRLLAREDRDVGLLAPRPTGTLRVTIDTPRPWEQIRGKVRIAITDLSTGQTDRPRPIWNTPYDCKLASGNYRLRIVETPWQPDIREFSIAAGETTEMTLQPSPAQVLSFRFHQPTPVDHSREPLAVTVRRLDAAQLAPEAAVWTRRVTPRKREWSVRCNLAPGTYRIEADLPSGATASHEFRVPADGPPVVRTRRLELR